MKKMIFFGVIATSVLTQAVHAKDRIYIQHNGSEERLYVDDLKTTAVCTLKQRVAGLYDLKMKKFDLKKGSTKLSEGKTLHGAYVRFDTRIKVVPVSNSNQC